jgi:dienelactone hydrolase
MKRSGLLIFRVLVIVVGVVIAWALYYAHRDYGELFQERRGRLAGVEEISRGTDSFGVRDVMVLAVDYPYQARPSYTVATFLRDVPALREALFEVFPSIMLVMDYLRTRPDIDTPRIVMLGYSFGAPFVPCVAAHERRFAAAGMLAGFLLEPVEPMKYAGRISPIPLVMINGTEDEQIPRENAERFFAAASEPKVIRWIESRHVHPRNLELTRLILATLSAELRRLHVLAEPPPARPARRHRPHFVR